MANKNEENKSIKASTKKVDSKTKTSTKKVDSKTKVSTKKAGSKTKTSTKKAGSKTKVSTKKADSKTKTSTKKVDSKAEIKNDESIVKKNDNSEAPIPASLKTIDEKQLNKEKNIKSSRMLGGLEKVVILVAVALVFSILGYFIGNGHNKEKDYDVVNKDLQIFIDQYNKVVEDYYQDVDKDLLIKGAISGMLSTLDEYSQVIDDSSNNFAITLEGKYDGIGVEIVNDSNGNILIYNVYDNTPAKKAGLEVSDIITKINDVDLKNVSTKKFVDMVGKFDDIKLTILRDSNEFTVELKKENIVLKSVHSEMLENNIGYIKVDLFANNTKTQFKEALEFLENENMDSLIIDLRNNVGGHLSTVKEMLSLFLGSSHVIYQTQSKTETMKFYSNGSKDKEYNIVILQNEESASASEIMASALKEQLNAYIIGKKSYGKGTVQQLETISGIGQYKFTTKKWLTSEGIDIDGVGITPDLEVTLDDNYYKNPTKENDSQLQEAIKYLSKN